MPTYDYKIEQWENCAAKYHRVMQLLVNARMQHGLCQPRERKACTACNAQDDLEKMVDEYKGAPVALQVPNDKLRGATDD